MHKLVWWCELETGGGGGVWYAVEEGKKKYKKGVQNDHYCEYQVLGYFWKKKI